MIDQKFQVLITFDQNIRYQQNLKNYPICILLLKAENNQYLTLKPLVEKILQIINGNFENIVYTINSNE